jgi:hypothetical protein
VGNIWGVNGGLRLAIGRHGNPVKTTVEFQHLQLLVESGTTTRQMQQYNETSSWLI